VQKTILLVDDDAIISLCWQMNLEKLGYHILTVSDGSSAVEAVKTDRNIDLILMDIDLGDGIDGIESSIEILKFKAVPIVFVSCHTEPEIIQKTEQVTSYGYIVKNSNIAVYDASIKMAFKLFSEKKKSMQIERVLKTSLDHIDQAIFISDEHGRIIQFNTGFAEVQGFSCKEECIEQLADYPKVFDVYTEKGKFAELGDWALSRALNGEIGTNIKYYIKRKDISDAWIGYYSFAPIFDEIQTLIGAIVLIEKDVNDHPDDPILQSLKSEN